MYVVLRQLSVHCFTDEIGEKKLDEIDYCFKLRPKTTVLFCLEHIFKTAST